MLHTPRKLSHRLAIFLFLAVTGLLMVLPGWPRDRPILHTTDQILRTPGLSPNNEAATPESLPAAAEPFPARQRVRHCALLGVDRWHGDGFRGQGVKIAVLDSGFRGYRAHLGEALPARVTCQSFRLDGNLEAKDSQHGILCGETIHALAPAAELLFANWEPDNSRQFLEAVRWARARGARVISCSLIMPSWSDGEGGGAVNDTLCRLLGKGQDAEDMLFFASAGNTAERHWSGAFQPDRHGLHQWRPGQTDNRLTPWGADPVSVELYGPARAQYEVSVVDETTGKKVGERIKKQGAPGVGHILRFLPDANASYVIRVRLARGNPEPFHLVALGGGLNAATARGSIPFPGDCPRVVTVGAATREGERLAYSSCGPNSRRPKPDFVAPVPFPSLWRSRPFSGTSAAAPQGAALAALCWSRSPDWTAEQVRKALEKAAKDLGPPGHDYETGYGLILAPRDLLAGPRPVRPMAMAP